MTSTRRHFLVGTATLAAGAAVGCRTARTPSVQARAARTVELVLEGVPRVDGAGVHLTRVIGQPALRNLDPFIMMDRFHSAQPSDYVAGFPEHPHRGFETITVMLDGSIRHRDSHSNQGVISSGGAQWMTAGRGVVHSEMPAQSAGLFSGFQLWLNLPAREKMCAYEYHDMPATVVRDASLSSSGSHMRVIAGDVNGLHGPVRARPTAPLLFTLVLEDERPFEFDVPREHTAFAFVHRGAVDIGGSVVRAGSLAVLSPGNRVRLRAPYEGSSVLFAAGRPLREPIVQRGPFVMNSESEIEQAFADYRAGVLGG